MPHAATLTWDFAHHAIRLMSDLPASRVHITGPGASDGIVAPLSSVHVDEWELVLIPPPRW